MPTSLLRRLAKGQSRPRYAVPEGKCVYAIGDVHGCLDQLNQVLDAIGKDAASRSARTQLILLGDLVDRGPQSSGVIERLATGRLPTDEAAFLMGNHEEVMLGCYDGATELYGSWLQYGGMETLESYGLNRQDLFSASFDLSTAMQTAIPPEHIRFIRSFRDSVRVGDYLFVHAGIRPGVALEDQSARDLRWIRRGFLDQRSDHGVMVVHGHTIVPKVEFRINRIAIDTGCYLTGQLSAVAIEHDSVRVLRAVP